ncbi:MAG: DUF4476 domain-containing protein [Ferruginibacter sp.]
MKLFLFIAALLFSAAAANAQHNHFVYLQSDNNQPFYVRVGDKLYSSSSSGYVIIPKLQQGSYSLNVGFPKNEWPQQSLPVEIGGKDLGFLLKNFDGKGWGLFNMQTMDITMAGSAAKPPVSQNNTAKSDDFSNTLADVVNTPSIKDVKKEQPAPKEEKKPEPEKREPVTVPLTTAEPQPAQTQAIQVSNTAPDAGSIKRINMAADNVATVYKYRVAGDGSVDTVDVVIIKEETTVLAPVAADKKDEPEKETRPQAANTAEPKFIDIDLPKADTKKEAAAQAPKPISSAVPNTLKMVNSDCKAIATEEDFLKARKKMSSQKSDDDMVDAAKKLFRQKCYSTEQIKNLSVLFLKDEGKYKFFDAAYPFVHDTGAFRQLESQLTEEYYISRFRSMLRN